MCFDYKLIKMPNQIVKRRKTAVGYYRGGAVINYLANHPDALRKARRHLRRWANQIRASRSRGRLISGPYRSRSGVKISKRKKKYVQVRGNAAGTTHTTSRLITRATPREQRFLRKIFKTNPVSVKYVNRFGFAWMGAADFSKTIWYSVCNLKFNNILEFFQKRPTAPTQEVGGLTPSLTSRSAIVNHPSASIYLGKCTYMYEIYNPTNYIVTVYIYDLVCKKDTPYTITYGDASGAVGNSAPENCMHMGSLSWQSSGNNNVIWTLADPTKELGAGESDMGQNAVWNNVGMKPTDYMNFNTLWKVKGVKKIILPPASSHHHNVIYNKKKVITLGNLIYPRMNANTVDNKASKRGLAGITQATLFGFEGQIAVNNDTNQDTINVGTLPGKLIVKCIRKENIHNIPLQVETVVNENNLVSTMNKPTIFTDLVEQDAMAT